MATSNSSTNKGIDNKSLTQGVGVVISDDVEIGDNVVLGNYVVIHPGVTIESGAMIQDFVVLGRQPKTGKKSTFPVKNIDARTVISRDSQIGTGSIIYRGAKIGRDCFIADQVIIRESTIVGEETGIGPQTNIKDGARIGKQVKIQDHCHITEKMIIEDGSFIGPGVITMSDKYMGRDKSINMQNSPTIRAGASIGGQATLLPGVTIGQLAIVGAGSVVTKDVPAKKVAVGVPAKVIKDVSDKQLNDSSCQIH